MSLTFDTPQALISHYAAVRQRIVTAPPKFRPPLALEAPKTPVYAPRMPSFRTRFGDDQDLHVRAYRRHVARLRLPLVPLVIEAAARAYGVSPGDIVGPRRTADVVEPRQVAAWVARGRSGMSWHGLGRHFNRDHTSILHAVRKIEMRHCAPALAKKIAAIQADVDANWGGS